MNVVLIWSVVKVLVVWALQIYGWRNRSIVVVWRAKFGRREPPKEELREDKGTGHHHKDAAYAVRRWLHETPTSTEEETVPNTPKLTAHDQK